MSGSLRTLAALTEAERTLAMERFSLLRPALEEGVSQTEVAHLHRLPLRTIQRWMNHYRKHGLVGLARQGRTDRGSRRGLPADLVHLTTPIMAAISFLSILSKWLLISKSL